MCSLWPVSEALAPVLQPKGHTQPLVFFFRLAYFPPEPDKLWAILRAELGLATLSHRR